MEHQNLVANELSNAGFKAEIFGDSVIVTLTNRKVSQMEVETALDQIFDGNVFDCTSIANGVLVSW